MRYRLLRAHRGLARSRSTLRLWHAQYRSSSRATKLPLRCSATISHHVKCKAKNMTTLLPRRIYLMLIAVFILRIGGLEAPRVVYPLATYAYIIASLLFALRRLSILDGLCTLIIFCHNILDSCMFTLWCNSTT